jgi:WD40 repeat protein
VDSATFSPDGMLVVTASEDGTARVWLMDWSKLIEYLKQATNACLTAEQRVKFLGETDSQAQKIYQTCERQYGRLP